MGFALELSDKEMRELLVYVTCEPDFQVNDYREMIFLYGFYHHLSYTKCLAMVDKFESSLPNNEAVPNFLKGIRHCFSL